MQWSRAPLPPPPYGKSPQLCDFFLGGLSKRMCIVHAQSVWGGRH